MKTENRKLKIWSACLALLLLVAGCGGGGGSSAPGSPLIHTLAEARQPARWTVLVYLDADNNLESAAIHNFNQMEAVGSTQDVHVIVQMDRRTGDDPFNEHWTDTRRYLITHDTDLKVMHSLRLDNPALGELNMANPNTLHDFAAWGESNFPADHYLLIVWDHGSGWQLRTLGAQPRYKAISDDETSNSVMNVTDMASALQGQNVDVLAFDACYMQQLEIAYQVRNCADYMVASTAAEPSPGYNYTRVLGRISGSTTPVQVCQMIVQQFAVEYPNPQAEITMSAVDLSKIAGVANAVSDLAGLLIPEAAARSSAFATARNNSLNYCAEDTTDYHSYDLIDYTDKCAAAVGSSTNAAKAALHVALSSAVIGSMHNSDMPAAHGLGIYVPAPHLCDPRYSEMALSVDTQWDEWLQAQR